jgi:hypothetical protein
MRRGFFRSKQGFLRTCFGPLTDYNAFLEADCGVLPFRDDGISGFREAHVERPVASSP